jgi:pilus assembly protein Flp/PilA
MLDKLFASLATRLFELRTKEDGQAMAEYGIILALVAVVVIASVQALGIDVRSAFNSVVNGI